MPYWTYVLESASTGGHYCGSTDHLARRLSDHHDLDYHGSKTTERFPGPWRLVWCEEHPTCADAMKRERGDALSTEGEGLSGSPMPRAIVSSTQSVSTQGRDAGETPAEVKRSRGPVVTP